MAVVDGMGGYMDGSRRRLRRGCRWSCRPLDSLLDFAAGVVVTVRLHGDGRRRPVGVGVLASWYEQHFSRPPGISFRFVWVCLGFQSGIRSGLASCVSFGFEFGFGGDGFRHGREERERDDQGGHERVLCSVGRGAIARATSRRAGR